jgi:hypothetical protein
MYLFVDMNKRDCSEIEQQLELERLNTRRVPTHPVPGLVIARVSMCQLVAKNECCLLLSDDRQQFIGPRALTSANFIATTFFAHSAGSVSQPSLKYPD